jgi:hypothetical protein
VDNNQTEGGTLPDLEGRRAELYARLASTGDFRRGSISENYRRCGKPNCACAQPRHPGHGPRFLWTRSTAGGKTKGRQLSSGELEKVRQELANYKDFVATTEAIVEVNEEICEARAVPPLAEDAPPGGPGAGKGGSSTGSGRPSRRK